MNIISMTLLTLLLLPLSGWSKDLNLFVIQRSKNTNEVQYQLHVNDRVKSSPTIRSTPSGNCGKSAPRQPNR